LFESLVALRLQTYATVNDVELKHFRTGKGDHEIDFIIEGDHAIVALEAKLSAGVDDSDVKHLNWLANKDLGKPLVRAVINSGDFAYTRADGTHVIPAALLGA
jgi:predicted AAA+ superfamily ATPase